MPWRSGEAAAFFTASVRRRHLSRSPLLSIALHSRPARDAVVSLRGNRPTSSARAAERRRPGGASWGSGGRYRGSSARLISTRLRALRADRTWSRASVHRSGTWVRPRTRRREITRANVPGRITAGHDLEHVTPPSREIRETVPALVGDVALDSRKVLRVKGCSLTEECCCSLARRGRVPLYPNDGRPFAFGRFREGGSLRRARR